MCGIIGSFRSKSDTKVDISSALKLLTHRGPDDHGSLRIEINDNSLIMAHTRLAIIDLSPSAHQPMQSKDCRFSIVFNGEIYNYKEIRRRLERYGYTFCTNSDTEVLLYSWAHWGKDCLPLLKGMFAFGVYDRLHQKLSLVRDAFGIKPLFYCQGDNYQSLTFASEVHALIKLLPFSPSLNLQRSFDYLVYGAYDDQQNTFFNGVKHLPPGHILEVSLLEKCFLQPVCWWKPKITQRPNISFVEAAQEVREHFLSNIRLHLRSDVPLGAALSGGLDSSAVVCAMRYVDTSMPIHTFTFVSPGSSTDEENWADHINTFVGAIPHKIQINPDELAFDLDSLITSQGEPFGSTTIYAQYRVFACARAAGIKVTLDGQGADELLAGYDGYPYARMRSMMHLNQFTSAYHFLQAWVDWPGRSKRRALLHLMRSLSSDEIFYKFKSFIFNANLPWLNQDWLSSHDVARHYSQPSSDKNLSECQGRFLVAELREALTGSGLSALLRHGDRNSMHWSIESRVPFLTNDFADLLLSLPEEFLISSSGETKHIFREAMRGIVPDLILNRRDKIGFSTPEQAWLQTLSPRLDSWLEIAHDIPFLNHSYLVSEIHSMLFGSKPFTWQAWRLINFCRWMQIYQPKIDS